MAKKMIYLVRHGQQASPETARGLGNGLTAVGKKQAELTAKFLRTESERTQPIRAIHFSTLRRAAETAAIIGAQFPELTPRGSRQLWEGTPNIPPDLAHFFEQVKLEEVERTQRQLTRAFARLFKPARRRDAHDIIVCHGNVIRYFVTRALGAPPEAWVHLDINNCGITRIVIEEQRGMVLLSHNETGHLPPSLHTLM